ncbi:hypothetical protein SDC9_104879 [bioreactor metagenome]|uniref:Outer membrane protein TolC n=1 Tax=bioreactor metagenome TaxID=1076179 RepID=A0A645AY01_9ZZZZ
MGGKIVAYNKITSYAEELASSLNDTKLQDIILRVDEIYWQNISLINKKKLVDNYVQLLRKMNEDVTDFHTEGLATKADELSARVKLNEAEMLQTKTDNGLELSKMLLCEICGLDIDSDIILADAQVEELSISIDSVGKVNLEFINNVFANRSEIRSLELANKIFDTKIDIARSGLMPTVALTANYMLSNPSMFSGVKKEFAGMFSVGVLVNVPIFHFGSTYNDIAISKIESHSKHLELEEAQEKIKLQVHQSVFRIAEANKQLIASQRNKENASENLRYAQIGFAEGVVPIINLMEAQTAWFKAHSQFIDSQIDVQLSKAYLNKAIGKKLK